MAAMRLEQVKRFILAKKIFWGYGHFKSIKSVFSHLNSFILSVSESVGRSVSQSVLSIN